MVNEISGVGLGRPAVSQVGLESVQRVTGSARPGEGILDGSVTRDDRVSFSGSAQVAGSFEQLRVDRDLLNKSAAVVRQLDDAVESAGQLLGKAEDKLGQIVKMYPPYPIDSPERVLLLNDLGGLRKQIDALTFPPPEAVDELGQFVGDRANIGIAASNKSLDSDAIQRVKDLLWDIPELNSSTASDEDVGEVLNQVKALKSSLDDLQTGMWKDVVAFVKQADCPVSKNEATGVREQIAELIGRGIGNNATQLVQAVESK
jgi:DNA-binding FrmR family transcriptional regulator